MVETPCITIVPAICGLLSSKLTFTNVLMRERDAQAMERSAAVDSTEGSTCCTSADSAPSFVHSSSSEGDAPHSPSAIPCSPAYGKKHNGDNVPVSAIVLGDVSAARVGEMNAIAGGVKDSEYTLSAPQ